MSKSLRDSLPKPVRWIFDGAKIAWSTEKLEQEVRINVDLDQEEGRAPSTTSSRSNVQRIVIRPAAVVKFDQLSAYLTGQADFGSECLQAINFLDHLLREYPSQRLTAIKRSFFQQGQQRFSLGSGAEAFKGVYQSMRIAHGLKNTLTVNVDVANGTFWSAGPLSSAVVAVLGLRAESEIVQRFRNPRAKQDMKRLRRLHVEAKHTGSVISYVIEQILDQTPSQVTIPGSQPLTTIAQYFLNKYKIKLRYPDWPLVKMTKKGCVLPLELLTLKENQRYVFKLDERQTSQMIKFAVTPPPTRWQDVQNGLKLLDWNNDPYLNGYGLKIDNTPVTAKARLIPNPKVTFANGDNDPRTSGRWDLRGKKFLTPNRQPLKSWGVCVISSPRSPMDKSAVDRFISEFVKTYIGHGGRVEAKAPYVHIPSSPDAGQAVAEAWQATGNFFKTRPQILVFILPTKDSQTYGRIKKSCECRFGVVSQCMQYANIQKCQAQYISNVLMKFNAKLGGTTARAIGPKTKGPTGIFSTPTMIVAADVTHPAPRGQAMGVDEQMSSVAAITNSMDTLATRYACGTNTNGYRVEMVAPDNWQTIWKPMVTSWMQNVAGGKLPQTIFYFRDGVSEGQFAAVLTQEVRDMKQVLASLVPNNTTKFVVIICSKRHHIRMFPKGNDADKNGNPLPGTLVETAVTHPYENDFFLCSHAALKGTARPTHYHILMNEPNLPNEMIQTLIYEHCYQFIRSTTPVSLFPAVYYADIAALRARHHDRNFGQNTPSAASTTDDDDASSTPSQVADLLPMPNDGNIRDSMWYI